MLRCYTSIVRVLRQIFSSHLGIAAAVSIVVLCGVSLSRAVSLFRQNGAVVTYTATSTADFSSPDETLSAQELTLYGLPVPSGSAESSGADTIAMIGPLVTAQLAGQYAGIQDSGTYSPDTIASAAQNLAPNIRASISYKTYTNNDIITDEDTTDARVLAYRADLRDALAPLLSNTTPELELFAHYIDTGDSLYLDQLKKVSANYHQAIENVTLVTAPKDAIGYQRGILNAMSEFATTIDGLSAHGTDALASAALLRTFNQAEENMYAAFNALAGYYIQKQS
jgi:hypothetical protein